RSLSAEVVPIRSHLSCTGAGSIAPEQDQKRKPVRDEEQRNDESRNEVRGLQHTRRQAGRIALIEGVEKIGSAPKVEYPDQGDAEGAVQSSQCKQGQHRGNEIAICGWHRESGRQIGRDDTPHQECEPDKSKTVQKEQRTQCVDAPLSAKVRPDV